MSTFAPLIGQPQAVELLVQAIARDRVAPAYLFAGASGIGKRLAARCFLELLLSPTPQQPASELLKQRIRDRNHPDLFWVEPTYLHQGKRLSIAAAEAAGVKRKTPPLVRLEQVREITQFLGRAPMEAPRSIVIIDQAETMPEPAANALLKTLEEPGQATIILLAPSVESLLPTLVSRCQRVPFYRLDPVAMTQVLRQTGQDDLLERSQLISLAQGSPGDAIAHGQKLESVPSDLLEALIMPPTTLRDALTIAKTIAKTLDGETQIWLLDYLQQQYWTQLGNVAGLEKLEKAKGYLLAYVQPQLVWEVTLMSMLG